ncbi:hypothetical protein H0A66_00595 [Alcaligenaceae bacterium]|nr:hypothetical protein [Alcaligenaceae bacterium]
MDSSWILYQSQPSFVLGFHGTERQTVEALIAEPTKHLKHSAGRYEWLGHGIYFWQNDPLRAYEWAMTGNVKSKIKEPDAVGTILDRSFALISLRGPGWKKWLRRTSSLQSFTRKQARNCP